MRQIRTYDFTAYSENKEKLTQNNYQFAWQDVPDPYLEDQSNLDEIEDELKQMHEWRKDNDKSKGSVRSSARSSRRRRDEEDLLFPGV
jgi:hypothetical protein